MHVINIHERTLNASATSVGALIDALATAHDALWPKSLWPRIKFDRALGVGASGGHGTIRYVVEEFVPGKKVKFRFLAPRGFKGSHWLEIQEIDHNRVILRHVIDMQLRGLALLSWPLIIRPLHDALLEDALTQAQASLSNPPLMHRWSPWVKFLRWIFSKGRAKSQQLPLPKR